MRKPGAFSPSVSCADSPSSEGAERAGRRKYAETGSFSLPQSAAPTASSSEGAERAGCRRYAETGSFSLPRSAAPTAHSSEGAKGGTPEVCGDREPFSPSVGCADSSLVRGSKGRDADSEGAERTQTGFGKTEKRGLWVPGGSADAGNAGNSGIRERRSWPRIY